jgi:hypothetical protein
MTKKDNKNLIIGVLVIVLVLVLLGSFGFGGYGMMMGYNPGFMMFGWIFNIIIIILIILGIFWLIKHVDFNGIKLK